MLDAQMPSAQIYLLLQVSQLKDHVQDVRLHAETPKPPQPSELRPRYHWDFSTDLQLVRVLWNVVEIIWAIACSWCYSENWDGVTSSLVGVLTCFIRVVWVLLWVLEDWINSWLIALLMMSTQKRVKASKNVWYHGLRCIPRSKDSGLSGRLVVSEIAKVAE